MRNQALLCLLLLAAAACRKPEPVSPCPDNGDDPIPCDTHLPCTPLPQPPLGGDWNWQITEYFVKFAVFNPTNGNEVLIQRDPFGGGWANSEFYRFYLNPGTLELVHEGNFTHGPSWGSSGWIAFTQASAPNWNIWKVKANGDSLTQLTFNGNSFRPIWSPDGTEIGYESGFLSQPALNGLNIRMSSAGTPIDTLWDLGAFAGHPVWFSQNRTYNVFAWVYSCTWGASSGTDLIYQLPDSVMQQGLPQGAAYVPATHSMVWSHRTGLYRTHLTTGYTERLIATCNSSYFSALDYSPHTNKLLAVRWRASTPDGVILNMENDVLLMNPDGTCPQVIHIPWPG